MTDTLALLGGSPVRTRPFPSWPVFGDPEAARLVATLRSGHWGKLDGQKVFEFENRFAATLVYFPFAKAAERQRLKTKAGEELSRVC